MSLLAISTGLAILATIGLVIGLVVLGLVIMLFSAVLRHTRQIARHAREVPEVAPFITNGVQGVDELRRTRELCSQVPPLALAYLAKITAGSPAADTPAAPSPSSPTPSPSPAPPSPSPAPPSPSPPPPAAGTAGAPSPSRSPARRGLDGLISGGKP